MSSKGTFVLKKNCVKILERNSLHIKVLFDFKVGLYNYYGEVIINPQYDDVVDMGHGIIKIKQSGFWAFAKYNGEFITAFVYNEVREFVEERCFAQKSNWSCIDLKGNLIADFDLYSVSDFKEGVARIEILEETDENLILEEIK